MIIIRYKICFLLFVISYLLSCALILNQVQGQSLSLSVSPPLTEIMIKPGKSVTQEFILVNLGDEAIINTQIAPFNNNGLILDNLTNNVPWMEVLSPSSPFLLKKGEKTAVLLKISPSESVKEQDYYQALLFNSNSPLDGRQSQSKIKQTLSVLILTSVTQSGLPKSAEISKFNLPLIADSFAPLKIDITVKNTGRSYFHPNGNLQLKGLLGKVNFPLIPRVYLAGEEKPLLLENNQDNKIKGFFLGKYSLKTEFVLDSGNIKVSREKVFYAFPYKLLIILISCFLLWFILKKSRS